MCGFQGASGPHPEETIYLALVTVIPITALLET
jgi:hypothetical protein